MKRLVPLAAATLLAALLAACTYDYLQRSDRVAYSAGDAVNANIEAETTDPANPNSGKTGGLGKNGPMDSASYTPPNTTTGG
jgi:hypothetical protein